MVINGNRIQQLFLMTLECYIKHNYKISHRSVYRSQASKYISNYLGINSAAKSLI